MNLRALLLPLLTVLPLLGCGGGAGSGAACATLTPTNRPHLDLTWEVKHGSMDDDPPRAQVKLLLKGAMADARAAFATLAGEVVTAGRIVLPELDSVYALEGKSPRPVGAAARIAPEVATRGFDWHNERAALLLELERRLAALPSDKAREKLLRRLRGTMHQTGNETGG